MSRSSPGSDLSEEAFFPWTSSPDLAARLDQLARENGCTISASGANDALLEWLPKLLNLTIRKPDHVGLTCASLINRLEQLVDSPAGYITTDRFPAPVHSMLPNNSRRRTLRYSTS